jgi:serine/threonine-protein kinase ATR
MDTPQNALDRRPSHAAEDSARSYIAARIAPHLSQAASYEVGLGRETFSQLRQEILRYDEDGPVNLDENLTDIHSLICVVIKAGLEPPCGARLRSSAAAASTEDVLAQIADCVDIIRLAVQKAPHVILEISNPEILGKGTIQAPLYAWLIPQLLSLLCLWDDANVQEKVCKTLSTICATQFKAVKLWHSARSIQAFMRACIRGPYKQPTAPFAAGY